MSQRTRLTHEDWDSIQSAMNEHISGLLEAVDRGYSWAPRKLARAEATLRKVDSMFVHTYPTRGPRVLDLAEGPPNG
jgi:hypothetical protein